MQWCANKNGLHTLRDITITSPHRHSNLRRADEPKALSANGPKHRPNHCTSMRITLRSSALLAGNCPRTCTLFYSQLAALQPHLVVYNHQRDSSAQLLQY